MVTARIAGLSPGTSPPPVRIPIRPFLVLMRPLCRFLRACKRKIDGSYWMCKRHRSEPRVSLLAIYRKPLTMHEPARCSGGRVACDSATREASMPDETVFRVTNSRYHANPSSDRDFLRHRCNDLTVQRITTAKLNVWTRPHFFIARKHCDANFVNILALGLHSGGASRFREACRRRRRSRSTRLNATDPQRLSPVVSSDVRWSTRRSRRAKTPRPRLPQQGVRQCASNHRTRRIPC